MQSVSAFLLLPPRLIYLLILKGLFLIAIIFYAGIELGPDEAQYWTWSQNLDWGYYSKPPGIAWQIWLGTQLFGQTEWGVRSFSIGFAFFQALAIYYLALSAGLLRQTAYWCSLCMAFFPLGMIGSLFAITDVGFLLCWTGVCMTLTSALHQKIEPSPLKVGGWIFVGALFKWPIYLIWLFFFLCHIWYFPKQRKDSILVGVLLSLFGLLPSIWWNFSHNWVTFRHVAATLQGGSQHPATGNIGEFLGSQVLLLSPILFILLMLSLWNWFCQRKKLAPPLFFCGFVTLISFLFFTVLSLFQKIQGNWMIFAYPTGLIVLGWNVFEQHPVRAKWVKIGIGISILMTSSLVLFPSFYSHPNLIAYAPPYRINPFKHNMGWSNLKQALIKHGYDTHHNFLLSDKYQTSSILSFYGPGQSRAYFLNLKGIRQNQFSYWPDFHEEKKGQMGYFVGIENRPYLSDQWQKERDFYQIELQRYFEKVEFLELLPLVYDGPLIAKAALIFRCQQCKDFKPVEFPSY